MATEAARLDGKTIHISKNKTVLTHTGLLMEGTTSISIASCPAMSSHGLPGLLLKTTQDRLVCCSIQPPDRRRSDHGVSSLSLYETDNDCAPGVSTRSLYSFAREHKRSLTDAQV